MADNSTKPIEEIRPCRPDDPSSGDVVLTAVGTKAYVIGIARSDPNENWPLVKIDAVSTDEQKDVELSICVTTNHSMCLNHEVVVAAGLLRPGDKLATIHHESTIKAIDLLNTNEPVWNVWLAPEKYVMGDFSLWKKDVQAFYQMLFYGFRQSLFGSDPKEHLFFGNGFLSGDFGLQNQLYQILKSGVSLNDFV